MIAGKIVIAWLLTTAVIACGTSLAVADPIPPALESISVPANGQVVSSSTILESGTQYYILAEGTWEVDYNGYLMDAEYAYIDIDPNENDSNAMWDLLVDGSQQDWLGSSQLAPDPIADFSDFHPHTYSPSHAYWISILGDGSTVDLQILDSRYVDNSGALTASLYLAPEPSAVILLSIGCMMGYRRKQRTGLRARW